MSQDDGKSISPPKEEGGARVQKPAPVVTVEILDAEQVLVAARAKAAEIAERKTRLAELQVVVDALPVTLRDIHYHLDVVVEVYNTRLGEIIKQIDEYSALFLQVNTVNGPEIEKPVMARLLFGELPATADDIPDHNLQILQAWVENLEKELAEAKKEFGGWISPEEHQTQMAGVVNEALKDSEEAQDLLEKRCARVEKERDEAVARAEEAEVETKRLGGDRDYWRGLSPDFHGSGEELTPTDQAEEVAEEAEEAPPPYWLQQDLDEEAEPVPVEEPELDEHFPDPVTVTGEEEETPAPEIIQVGLVDGRRVVGTVGPKTLTPEDFKIITENDRGLLETVGDLSLEDKKTATRAFGLIGVRSSAMFSREVWGAVEKVVNRGFGIFGNRAVGAYSDFADEWEKNHPAMSPTAPTEAPSAPRISPQKEKTPQPPEDDDPGRIIDDLLDSLRK